jgi:hypothetical protein
MSNTLTNLIPDLYAAMDTVSRELAGFIPSVTLNASPARAALNQTIRSPLAPAATASDITPGVTPPNDGDQTIGNRSMTISKTRRVPVRWSGEEALGVDTGLGFGNLLRDQFAQAIRTLCNEVEADLAALYLSTSRAYGTAGTTPFATDLSDTASVLKILLDNGSPTTDLQLVMNTTAGAKLRTMGQLTKANEAGDTSLLRQGVLLDIHGFALRESAQVKNVVKGTGSAYQVNNVAGYAVGATTIAADTGTGTILAGDVVTFTGDSNKYVVESALSGGSFTIAAPGLRQALANDTAITVGNSYAANMAFSRSAIALATRAPALPPGGDMADDRTIITDPNSGLSFDVALYRQYHQVQYEISLAWGVANFKPEHTAILLG